MPDQRFINSASLAQSWRVFERLVARLMFFEGYRDIRVVGQAGDRGADILASRGNRRWLVQAKHWQRQVGVDVVDSTLAASRAYRAMVPVIASRSGFRDDVYGYQEILLGDGIPLQLWDSARLEKKCAKLMNGAPIESDRYRLELRPYQESAIRLIVEQIFEGWSKRALVVMATGLGKTTVAAEAIRRSAASGGIRVLALAHTNALVYQLERAFWPFLDPTIETLVWNGLERPDGRDLERAEFAFACIDSVYHHIQNEGDLPEFDIILVDECHHAASTMYRRVFEATAAGLSGGPFLLGLTATPWRADGRELSVNFDEPIVTVDLVTGLRNGYLSEVDYRMYTDNINWLYLEDVRGADLSPRRMNRRLFIDEWDDSVIDEIQRVWDEQDNPRAVVFCGTIDHALIMRDRINARAFCRAEALYSSSSRAPSLSAFDRNRILTDFHDDIINLICAVDIFNEGIDVPDVNIVIFQRVTHSRRIFVQQLGRGLRLAPGKRVTIVLDFVSDIRRFAAGIELKNQLSSKATVRTRAGSRVEFRRIGGTDPEAESFLRAWLEDVATIEGAGEDAHVLRFPPALPGSRS